LPPRHRGVALWLGEPPILFRLTRLRLTSSILSHSTRQLLSFPQEEYERNRHLDCQQPEVQFPARSVHLPWRGVRSGKVLADDAHSMARDLRERRSGQANTVAERSHAVAGSNPVVGTVVRSMSSARKGALVVVQLQLPVQLSLSKAWRVVRRNRDLRHKVVHLDVYVLARKDRLPGG
jgi:hypothetical protein